jgi:hypothetical protein
VIVLAGFVDVYLVEEMPFVLYRLPGFSRHGGRALMNNTIRKIGASRDAVNEWALISARNPHILFMTQWQKSYTREPPKTKAQLREMLTEAVRNTQREPKRSPKTRKDFGASD